MKKPFAETKVGKFFSSKVGSGIKELVVQGLQATPIVGTFVTNFKENTKENPAGKINFTKWDVYRLIVGFAAAYALHKGILTKDHVSFITDMIGM